MSAPAPRVSAATPAKAGTPVPARRTLLTFRLQGEIFAIEVERVREIIDPLPAIRVPHASAFAPGLINVRGSVVPVVALRQRLGIAPAERTADSRMVVLDVALGEETTRLAIEADAVEQVLDLDANAIEPVPEIGVGWPTGYLAGIAKRGGDLVVLLKTEAVFEPG
ncbi:MAG: chemotaxis protein CheW [Pseudomonadota bacterium]